jgi:hypothetical protein
MKQNAEGMIIWLRIACRPQIVLESVFRRFFHNYTSMRIMLNREYGRKSTTKPGAACGLVIQIRKQ